MAINAQNDRPADLQILHPQETRLVLRLAGDWLLRAQRPAFSEVEKALAKGTPPSVIVLEDAGVGEWDSALMAFLQNTHATARLINAKVETRGFPDGVRRLMEIAESVPERSDAQRGGKRKSLFHTIGTGTLNFVRETQATVEFIGEAAMAMVRFFLGKARFRWSDVWLIIQQTGPQALPIVALISFLVGLIMAFVGAVQLSQFGASIYVANLVGLAMVREMGAMMTGVIMCGRTGAAFAAQLGTMKVSEEIDALQTLGIPPMDFLVLPRMLAMILMMPILVLFANFIGMIGGMVVSLAMLDLTYQQYLNQTLRAIDLVQFSTGMSKSVVFGVIVAITGCQRGMQCGSSSAAVGMATTSAVVTGITALIVADAIFAVIFSVLGI